MSESTALARVQEQPSELTTWQAMREQANELVKSGFLPRAVNSPEKALAIMQTGRELGIGPMQALRCIHIIEGKPCMSADLIAGLALSRVPGSTLRVAETSNTVCRVEAARAGQPVTTFSFSIDDARQAGLVGKDNWKRYPRAMLRARALTEACRGVFPDAVAGIFDPDELGAITNAAGEVVALPRVTEVSPHHGPGESLSDPDKLSDEFNDIMGTLDSADRYVFSPACTYEEMVAWRGIIGSKGQPSELGKRLSALYHGNSISPSQRKEMGALWNRLDRKLTQLESRLQPPPVEASFTDPEDDDGTDAFGAKPEGAGGDDD